MIRWLIPLLLLIAAACAPSGETAVPTLTLIPATETYTPTPAPPTSTPANLPAPQDVIPTTATPTPFASSSDLTGDALVTQDAVAAALVSLAQRIVGDQTDLPTRRIRVVDVRAAVWTDSALNCPLPDSSDITSLKTDGYRIVLQAGDQEYIFHTDFDRVVPCDPANEQLPEGFMLPTSEATPEATEA